MELLKKDKQWFLSEEGGKKFAALNCVGDRAVFIYSYLKTISNEAFEKDNILFKTAFLLADEVYNSNLEYSQYPEILSEKANPFVAFLSNSKKGYTEDQIYCIFLSFIHGISNPFNKADWIYNEKMFKDDEYIHKLDELGHMFVIPNKLFLPNAEAYKCDEKYNMIQLEVVWLFCKDRRS